MMINKYKLPFEFNLIFNSIFQLRRTPLFKLGKLKQQKESNFLLQFLFLLIKMEQNEVEEKEHKEQVNQFEQQTEEKGGHQQTQPKNQAIQKESIPITQNQGKEKAEEKAQIEEKKQFDEKIQSQENAEKVEQRKEKSQSNVDQDTNQAGRVEEKQADQGDRKSQKEEKVERQEKVQVIKQKTEEEEKSETTVKGTKKLTINSEQISLKFHTIDQSQKTKPHFPTINKSVKVRVHSKTSEITEDVVYSSKLYQNQHLRYLYHYFCKQMYKGGPNRTFDQISESGEKMPLSKWMVFCKEFDLTKKLTSREAISIFRQATNYSSEMSYFQFIKALQITKEKTQISERQLVKDMLHAKNHYGARDKLRNLKVHYSGPKKNYFEECIYTEDQKKAVRPRNEYQKAQYKRQQILHQGMSREHLERELNERKKAREEKKQNYRRNYHNLSEVSHKAYISQHRTESKKTKQKYFQSYKTIFRTKKLSERATTLTKSGLTAIDHEKISETMPIGGRKQNKIKIVEEEEKDILRDSDKIVEVSEWNIDSEAESDEILRQHYELEKEKNKKEKEKNKEQMEEDYRRQQLEDQGLLITAYD